MNKLKHTHGYFKCGMPYNKFGQGSRTIVVFQGLLFENKPMNGFMIKQFLKIYKSLTGDYTVFIVTRKNGMPEHYSIRDIADDYAQMIRKEFGSPVDVLGVSTGGSIVQHFAANHPDLVTKLVIHSSAYTLNDSARSGQMRVAQMAQKKKWTAAFYTLIGMCLPENGIARYLLKPLFLLISFFGRFFIGIPKNPSDLIITIKAEDKHDFRDRLGEISAPTLVIAGEKDPFYSVDLFQETARGIPNAKLVLYKGVGHPASGKQFGIDLLTFLNE